MRYTICLICAIQLLVVAVLTNSGCKGKPEEGDPSIEEARQALLRALSGDLSTLKIEPIGFQLAVTNALQSSESLDYIRTHTFKDTEDHFRIGSWDFYPKRLLLERNLTPVDDVIVRVSGNLARDGNGKWQVSFPLRR
jgi:hypothetical protein